MEVFFLYIFVQFLNCDVCFWDCWCHVNIFAKKKEVFFLYIYVQFLNCDVYFGDCWCHVNIFAKNGGIFLIYFCAISEL